MKNESNPHNKRRDLDDIGKLPYINYINIHCNIDDGERIALNGGERSLNDIKDPVECYELFWDDAQGKYFSQYKNGVVRDIWRAYVSAFFAMFTGRGVYWNAKTNHLDWKERIAAIVFNLINFGGLASLIFGIANLSPFLLVVGGILVLTGFYLAWQGSKIAKESRRIYIETQIQENQKWLLVSKDAENINLVPVQSDSKLVSDGIGLADIDNANLIK